MSAVCECGCGEPVKDGRRFRHAHYKREPSAHDNYQAVDTGYTTPCWLWQGSRTAGGYGRTTIARRPRMAHRVTYERANGPVPAGLQLDHLCRQPACVNPAHLEPVTCKVNMERRYALQTTCKHGHAFVGDNFYVNAHGFRVCRVCKRINEQRRIQNRSVAAA